MRIFLTTLILSSLLTSCNLINFHNTKNDFKYKNDQLSNKLDVTLMFKPFLIKEFNDLSTLNNYFKKSNNLDKIESILRNKLSKRNFNLTIKKNKNIITIDTLIFSDKIEMMDVYSNEGSNFLGSYEKNDIQLKIIGNLIVNDTINTEIISKYEFTEEPRESFIFKKRIVYSNSLINIDKVLNNLFNKFSFECYKIIKENKTMHNNM